MTLTLALPALFPFLAKGSRVRPRETKTSETAAVTRQFIGTIRGPACLGIILPTAAAGNTVRALNRDLPGPQKETSSSKSNQTNPHKIPIDFRSCRKVPMDSASSGRQP